MKNEPNGMARTFAILKGVASAPMTEADRQEQTRRALETLEALAETWVEKCGIAPELLSIPVHCVTAEQQARSHALILRFVKHAYLEGFYNGQRSIAELWDEK